MKYSFFTSAILFVWVLAGCNSSPKEQNVETTEVKFEFLDSIVVDSLSELYLSAKNEQTCKPFLGRVTGEQREERLQCLLQVSGESLSNHKKIPNTFMPGILSLCGV